jgi:hypothetical protein
LNPSYKKIINYFPATSLFFLNIITPQGNQLLKYSLLSILCFQIFINFIYYNRIYLHKKIFILFLFYIFIGLYFGAYGLVVNNPGAISVTKMQVLYIIIYMFLIMTINNISIIRHVHKIILFSTLFLLGYHIVAFLNVIGIWPDWLFLEISGKESTFDMSKEAMIRTGRLEVETSSLPSFLFLYPYMLTYLFVTKEKNITIYWIALLGCSIFMLISSVRILLVIYLLFSFLIIIFLKFNKGFYNILVMKKWIKSLAILLLSMVVIFELLNLSVISYGWHIVRVFLPLELERVVEGGNTVSDYNKATIIPNRRYESAVILYNNWLDKPFFGHGSGAVGYRSNGVPYMRGDINHTWAYELIYSQYLFNWGLVGFLSYALGLFIIYKTLLKIFYLDPMFAPYAISILFGSLGFMVGTASNPYLIRYDSYYVIFLPIAVVNLWLMTKRGNLYGS